MTSFSLSQLLQLIYHVASQTSSIFTCNICAKSRGLFSGYFLTIYAFQALILLAFWRSFQRVPWQIKSTFIMQFYFLSYKFKIPYIPNYLIIYFVPLPLPSIAITPFSSISFSNFVVFDFPKGIYGAISLIGFSIVLLKSL